MDGHLQEGLIIYPYVFHIAPDSVLAEEIPILAGAVVVVGLAYYPAEEGLRAYLLYFPLGAAVLLEPNN